MKRVTKQQSLFSNIHYVWKSPAVLKYRRFFSSGNATVLGIETSCDDTGCAIVNGDGKILGDSLNSQQELHMRFGGIIPPIASRLHKSHISEVVNNALRLAELELQALDAIAVTVKPGLPLSLLVGIDYGKYLCKASGKPFIPIHHMEAHALTIRMVQQVEFPFLVLLVSGGHCQLAVAQAPNDFLLLGTSLDDAPGEAFDKISRRLKLRNIPEFTKMSGGQAIERAAEKGDPMAFKFDAIMSHRKNCDFSFSGIKEVARRLILKEEKTHGIEGGQVIPTVYDLAASFQLAVFMHILRRVQRGMEYVDYANLMPSPKKSLVVSGGVACNGFLRKLLNVLCREMEYELLIPPPKLCTDNGIMIAWNGIEKWKLGIDIFSDFSEINYEKKCPLGKDVREDVFNANINCNMIRRKYFLSNS